MTTAFNTSVICPILIGRTAELAAFHLLIDQVKSGRGQVALLCGEAGVGKSRLVVETKTYAASQGFCLMWLLFFLSIHLSWYHPLSIQNRSNAVCLRCYCIFLLEPPHTNRCCSSLKICTGSTRAALNSCCSWHGVVDTCPSCLC